MPETETLRLVLFWMSFPFLVIGFIANLLVIRIAHETREMQTPTNCLLVNMAFSDGITILLSFIFAFWFSKVACMFVFLTEMSIMVSAITITVVALDRYHALKQPLRTGLRIRQDNIKKTIALIWIASVVICLPELFFMEWSKTYSTCIGSWGLHMNQASKVYMIIKASIFCIELVVMCYCYGSLIRGLYFTNTVRPETDGERSSEKKRLVITQILATTGFIIGYAPGVVFYTVVASEDAKHDEQMNLNLYTDLSSVFTFLFRSSLCFKPILYAFRITNFHEGFKNMLSCREQPPQNEIQLTAFNHSA